jgi:hypothetical protein
MMLGMPRHEYILHYATARPFVQYALKVALSENELAVLEERLDDMVEEGELHHFDLVNLAGSRPTTLEEALHDLHDTCRH